VWKAAAAYEVGGRREPKPSEEAEEVAEEREGHRDEQRECCKAMAPRAVVHRHE